MSGRVSSNIKRRSRNSAKGKERCRSCRYGCGCKCERRGTIISKPQGKTEDGQLKDITKELCKGTATAEQHYKAQMQDYFRYCATFVVLLKNGVKIASNSKIRALAVAFGRNDTQLVSAFLRLRSQFGPVEVLKAITLLDTGRQVRSLERQLRSLESSATKVNPQKIDKLKIKIKNLNMVKMPIGSASGAVCKHIRRWAQSFTKDELEFQAIQFPKDPWKKLADICHFNPKDFSPAPWFLPYCFGISAVPDYSPVKKCQYLNYNNVVELVIAYAIPFTAVKKFKERFCEDFRTRITAFEPNLDIVLWNFEDLQCGMVEEILNGRLIFGDPVNLSKAKLLDKLLNIALRLFNGSENLLESLEMEKNFFTKLIEMRDFKSETILRSECDEMDSIRYWRLEANPVEVNEKVSERLLSLVKHFENRIDNHMHSLDTEDNFFTKLIEVANTKLTRGCLSLESPLVILGDASFSMGVAIRTSTIIASLLSSSCSVKLVFFNTDYIDAPFVPKSVTEMFKLALMIKTAGLTCPAAALFPFYEKKEVVKTFIVVTDEEENSSFKDYRFSQLFKKYHEEVYPATLVFVSLLPNQLAEGQMVKELQAEGFSPWQVKLDRYCPDHSKLESFLGQLSTTTEAFQELLLVAERECKENGIVKDFEGIYSHN